MSSDSLNAGNKVSRQLLDDRGLLALKRRSSSGKLYCWVLQKMRFSTLCSCIVGVLDSSNTQTVVSLSSLQLLHLHLEPVTPQKLCFLSYYTSSTAGVAGCTVRLSGAWSRNVGLLVLESPHPLCQQRP